MNTYQNILDSQYAFIAKKLTFKFDHSLVVKRGNKVHKGSFSIEPIEHVSAWRKSYFECVEIGRYENNGLINVVANFHELTKIINSKHKIKERKKASKLAVINCHHQRAVV